MQNTVHQAGLSTFISEGWKGWRKKGEETTPLFVFCSLMALHCPGKLHRSSFILLQICKVLRATWEGAENPFQSLWNTVWCSCIRHSKCNYFSLWRGRKACYFLSPISAIYPSLLSCSSIWDGSHVRWVDLNWTEQHRRAKLTMKWQGWERTRIVV